MQRNVDVAGTGFATRLSKLRSAANLTKAELAERSGVSFRTIHNYEKGHSRRVQEKTLRLLATALDVSYEYLLYGREATPPPDRTPAPVTEPAVARPPADAPRRRPRRYLTIFIVVGIVIAASYWGLQAARVQSAVVEVEGNRIIVRDDLLKLKLWEHGHDSAIQESRTVDINGRKEVVYGLWGDHADSGHLLVCDLANGRIRWQAETDVAEAMRAFGPVAGSSGGFGAGRIRTADIDGDGTPEIVVCYGHTKWYPACVTIYRADGRVVGSYYNGGHFYAIHVCDLDHDGKDEILLGATNNGKRYQGASVILLDDVCCHGASTDSLMMADSQLPDSCAVREIFPQFAPPFMDLCGGARGSSRLQAERIQDFETPAGETRLQFDVRIGDNCVVVITDADLHPISVAIADNFLTTMDRWRPQDRQRFIDGLDTWLAGAYRYGARR